MAERATGLDSWVGDISPALRGGESVALSWAALRWPVCSEVDGVYLSLLTLRVATELAFFVCFSSQMLASSQQPSLPNQSVTDTSGRPTPRGPGCPPLGLTSAGQN